MTIATPRLLLLAFVGLLLTASNVMQAPSTEATYQRWTYPVPVDADTQSGMPILDANGRVFSVVRNDGRLQVWRDDVRVVDETDGYGAVAAQVSPRDGCLLVSALKGRTPPRREWIVVRVPGFSCFSFISRAANVPQVYR